MRSTVGALFLLALGSAHLARAEDDRSLKTLTLDQALAELDSQSPTLVQVRSRVADARALATQARVPLVPTVIASGGYTRNSADARVDFSKIQLPGLPAGALPSGPLVIQPLGVWTVAGTVRVPLIIPNAWADWSAAQRAADRLRPPRNRRVCSCAPRWPRLPGRQPRLRRSWPCLSVPSPWQKNTKEVPPAA